MRLIPKDGCRVCYLAANANAIPFARHCVLRLDLWSKENSARRHGSQGSTVCPVAFSIALPLLPEVKDSSRCCLQHLHWAGEISSCVSLDGCVD